MERVLTAKLVELQILFTAQAMLRMIRFIFWKRSSELRNGVQTHLRFGVALELSRKTADRTFGLPVRQQPTRCIVSRAQ